MVAVLGGFVLQQRVFFCSSLIGASGPLDLAAVPAIMNCGSMRKDAKAMVDEIKNSAKCRVRQG
jgi:hypothetical protein